MGSSESKLASVASEAKPEVPFKPSRVNQLMDPRSPSADINRTPIQVSDKDSAEVKTVCPVALIDPRSPSVDISRTPVREVMRATVGTFARRLGMLLHNDAENKAQQRSPDKEEDEDSTRAEELASTEPLLPPQPQDALPSLDAHAAMLDTPPQPDQDAPSPFVFLEDLQQEVELETEPDLSYEEAEEAEEAREVPLSKRLSLSLVACHEGQSSSQVYGDVTNGSFQSTEEDVDPKTKEDHSYAVPPVTVQSPVEPPVEEETTKRPEKEENKAEVVEVVNAPTVPPFSASSNKPEKEAPGSRPQRIRCPTIDAKSPSQVVFKPQWLGKGFGGAGLRVNAGKGGSSPLALKVAVKKVSNENGGQAVSQRRPKDTDGRSPLQILRETNSPRGQSVQMKMKVSTPEKRRSAPGERRALAVAVDKENR